MHYELMSAEEYENLAEDPEQQFVEIENICRRNMTQMIDQNTSVEFDTLVRLQYMTTVAAAATELGIEGVEYPFRSDYPAQEIDTFLLTVSGVVTRIRLRASRKNRPYSVQLGTRTKAKIELQVRKLRGLVEEAEIPEAKRQALIAKLDELSVELNQTRLSFAKTMAVLASVSVAVAAGTSFLADAPVAIATIVRLIGSDKNTEEEEAARLAPPPKALPAPEEPRVRRPAPVFDTDLDDDVPF
jgi:predicted RNA binding protein with dsRBD fold (UPF0201 family)